MTAFSRPPAPRPAPLPAPLSAHLKARLSALPAGTALHLAVRYQRLSGALSGFSPPVTTTPLAPVQPKDGRDGRDGVDGADGPPGPPGIDGREGKAGTQLLTLTRTVPGWSDALATQAVLNTASRPPATGDLVTQRLAAQAGDTGRAPTAPTAPTAQTRIWNGTGWAEGGQILNGNLLISGTIAAHALRLDGTTLSADVRGALSVAALSADRISGGRFTSRGYRPGQAGFIIDSAGHAEFNHATVRGTIDSSLVRASRLLSSSITYVTEAGGRFATLSTPRPVAPRWTSTDAATNTISLLDLHIAPDQQSRFLGDAHAPVLTAADRHGDNTARTDNSWLTRFHRFAPRLALACRYDVPAGQTPFGAHINTISPQLIIKTKTGMILADTKMITIRAHRLARLGAAFTRQLSVTRTGFDGPIDIIQTRTTMRTGSRHYTTSFDLNIVCRPVLNPVVPLQNQPLCVDLKLLLEAPGRFPVAPFTVLGRNITLTMDTLS